MKTSLTLPGARQDLDVRVCVTLEPDELPWPLRFYFLFSDADTWMNVGFEIGIGEVRRDAIDSLVDDEISITPSRARWMQENFFHYRALAEQTLNTNRFVAGPRSGSSPEGIAYLAAQYGELQGQRGAIDYLAKVHGVSRQTIWRRLKKAGIARDS